MECDAAQEVAAFRQVSSSSSVAAVVVVGSASRMVQAMTLMKEALFLHGQGSWDSGLEVWNS